MPIIEFSDNDILRTKIVTPDWYRVRVNSVGTKPSTSQNPDTTTIWPIEGTILYNANTGSKEFAGVPTPAGWNFNDNPRARGFMVGFFEALGVEVKSGVRLELKNSEGKELDVFIENDIFEGRTINRINHKYRKPRND